MQHQQISCILTSEGRKVSTLLKKVRFSTGGAVLGGVAPRHALPEASTAIPYFPTMEVSRFCIVRILQHVLE